MEQQKEEVKQQAQIEEVKKEELEVEVKEELKKKEVIHTIEEELKEEDEELKEEGDEQQQEEQDEQQAEEDEVEEQQAEELKEEVKQKIEEQDKVEEEGEQAEGEEKVKVEESREEFKYIYIGTTAINRPPLHLDNMSEWCRWITSIDPTKYIIRWFINIDIIEKLQSSFEETKENFNNIIKDNNMNGVQIDVYYYNHPKMLGNFLEACKRISDRIKKHIKNDDSANGENSIIIWLEDDWKFNLSVSMPLMYIIDTYLLDHSLINLTYIRLNYIHALAPYITTYNLWKDLFYDAWKKQRNQMDPEHCVGIYYNKKLKLDKKNMYTLTLITKHKSMKEKELMPLLKLSDNSYYCYDDIDNNKYVIDHDNMLVDNKNKHIQKNNIKSFFKKTQHNSELNERHMIFIRITCGFCKDGVDYGRKFMEQYDLIKKRIQNNNNIDFYKTTQENNNEQKKK